MNKKIKLKFSIENHTLKVLHCCVCTVEPHIKDTSVLRTAYHIPNMISSIQFDLSNQGSSQLWTVSISPEGVLNSEFV